MLTITDYASRIPKEGNPYFALELTSNDPEVVLSQSGKYYITVRKCYMSSTFPESICQAMIGKQFPGSVSKVECEPYEFTIPETGEVITRQHRYEYVPVEQSTPEQAVFENAV